MRPLSQEGHLKKGRLAVRCKIKGILKLMRHGQTEWNVSERFAGHADIPLTPQGFEEAKATAMTMRDLHFDEAHSSTLIRAIDTTTTVLDELKQSPPIITARALIEKGWGDLEGQSRYDHEEERERCMSIFDHAPPNGESYQDAWLRMATYYQDVLFPRLLKGMNLLVTSHAGSSRMLICYLEGASWETRHEMSSLPTAGTATYFVTKEGAARIA